MNNAPFKTKINYFLFDNFQPFALPMEASVYYPFIRDWREELGNNLHIILSEDYYHDRISVMKSVINFLGLGK